MHIKKAPAILKETFWEQRLLPKKLLFQERLCLFQQDNDKLHTTSMTTAWLPRVLALNKLTRKGDLSSLDPKSDKNGTTFLSESVNLCDF